MNSTRILVILCMLLISCKLSKRDGIKDEEFNQVLPSIQFNSKCDSNFLEAKRVSISFSNDWNEYVLAALDDREIFHDSIKTEKSTGVTGKSFTISRRAHDPDTVSVYLLKEKLFFRIGLEYKYKYIHVFNTTKGIVLNKTNCQTLLY